MTDRPDWREALVSTGRVELGLRRGRTGLTVLGGVALTASGVWLARDAFVLGVVVAAVCGLLTVGGLWALLASGPVLVLTTVGLELRSRPRSLPWAQVLGAHVRRQPAAELLVVAYVDEAGAAQERTVASGLLEADLDEVAAWIDDHAAARRG